MSTIEKLEELKPSDITLSKTHPVEIYLDEQGHYSYIVHTDTNIKLKYTHKKEEQAVEEVVNIDDKFYNKKDALELILNRFNTQRTFDITKYKPVFELLKMDIKKPHQIKPSALHVIKSFIDISIFDEDPICFKFIGESQNILIDLTDEQALTNVLVTDHEPLLNSLLQQAKKFDYIIIDETHYLYQALYEIKESMFDTTTAKELVQNVEIIMFDNKIHDKITRIAFIPVEDNGGFIQIKSETPLCLDELASITSHLKHIDPLKKFNRGITEYDEFMQVCY